MNDGKTIYILSVPLLLDIFKDAHINSLLSPKLTG